MGFCDGADLGLKAQAGADRHHSVHARIDRAMDHLGAFGVEIGEIQVAMAIC